MKSYLLYLNEVLGVNGVMMPTPLQAHVVAHSGGHSGSPAEEIEGLEKPAFFYSPHGAMSEGQSFSNAKLAIVNWVHQADESLFEDETADLFEKMFAAMKILPQDVLVLDCVMNERNLIPNELYKIASPQIVLFFCSEPSQMGEFQIKGPARWIETLSPAFLRHNPSSKKIVWKDMQKVMGSLT
jgi:hypothetical protein